MSFSPRWDTPSATPHAWPSGTACAALTGWHAVLHEDGFPGHPPAALLYGRALLFRPTSIPSRKWEVDKAFAEIIFSVILGHLSSIYPRINSVFPGAALFWGSCSGVSRSAGGWAGEDATSFYPRSPLHIVGWRRRRYRPRTPRAATRPANVWAASSASYKMGT